MLSVHSCPIGNLGAKDTGGMSVYVRELARELGRQGHLVDIYTRVHGREDNQVVPLGENARIIHLEAGKNRDVPKLALYSDLPDFTDHLEGFREDNNLRYDLIFSHYWLSGWVGESLRRWWQVPHITMFHTLGAVKNAIGRGEAEPELRLNTEKHLAGNCQRIIATTEREKEALIRHYDAAPERIGVVPCGVNLSLFQPMDKERAKHRLGFGDDKVILFVGRLEPLKGLDQLLQAMTYLPHSQRPRLVIIGGDEHSQPEMERLKRLSRYLQIQESVTFSGLVSQEYLPCYYGAADVSVVPSYYESFSLVALESLACGTPVVATDVGNIKNIIRNGETGYVIRDNNPRLLADKIALLLSPPGPDAASVRTIRASVTQFSWLNIAPAITQEFSLVHAGYLAPVH